MSKSLFFLAFTTLALSVSSQQMTTQALTNNNIVEISQTNISNTSEDLNTYSSVGFENTNEEEYASCESYQEEEFLLSEGCEEWNFAEENQDLSHSNEEEIVYEEFTQSMINSLE